MFDNNVFIENSLHNVTDGQEITGFELETYITYYRGIPLSMVNEICVKVDGTDVPRGNISFSADKGKYWFTLDEMETVVAHKWEYNLPAKIFVKQEGGLSKGEHEVSLTVNVRTAYIPVPLIGEKTRTVVI